MVLNTCALYGASNYANSWIGINVLIIMASIAIVAFVYSISRFFPDKTRAKFTELSRAELTTAFFSAVLIMSLIVLTQVTCNASLSLTHTILLNSGLPQSETSLTPFQYASYYTGTLATHTGIGLLTQLYYTSIRFGVEGQVLDDVGTLLLDTEIIPLPILSYAKEIGTVYVHWAPNSAMGTPLKTVSNVLISVLSVIVSMALGVSFIQYLAVPVIQYTAFVVVLPVALALRSISFAGKGLRSTSNAFIAIAIAAYVIFPMTIAFDGYVMAWTFTACSPSATSVQVCNPSYAYLQTTQKTVTVSSGAYFSSASAQSTDPSNLLFSGFKTDLLGSLSSIIGGTVADAAFAMSTVQGLANEVAQFVFQATALFAINAAITVGFAISLAKSLDAGIEGASSFWSNL